MGEPHMMTFTATVTIKDTTYSGQVIISRPVFLKLDTLSEFKKTLILKRTHHPI